MTVSTHVYSAWLIGAPDVELSIKDGEISLDATSAPHVSADLRIATPDEAVLVALDPREAARIRVDVDATYPSGVQSRSFDLGLRNRSDSQGGADLSLALASDEALAGDYAPLTDDNTPRSLEASLRDVVDYVIDQAIPGAALSVVPAVDADVTAYWSVSNMFPNPVNGNPTPAFGWVGTTGAPNLTTDGGVTFAGHPSMRVQATATGNISVTQTNSVSASEGDAWTASIYLQSHSTSLKTAELVLRFVDRAGSIIMDHTSPAAATTTSWVRYDVTAIAPPGTTGVQIHVSWIGPHVIGNLHYTFGPMLHRGSEVVPIFHGAQVADADYTYAFEGDADASTSTRTPILERLPEALIWKSGQSALDFLHPLVQSAGLRLVCDESRVWTLRDENYVAPGSLSIVNGVNMIEGSATISRDDETWFDAAVARYRWTDTGGIVRERYDTDAMTTPHTRVRLFEFTTPYPGPGFAAYAVRRAQGRGREVEATAVSDWRGNAEQPVSIVLDGSPNQIGTTERITFNLSTDEMNVTTRSVDTPVGAIDLLTGTIDSLIGTIDSL